MISHESWKLRRCDRAHRGMAWVHEHSTDKGGVPQRSVDDVQSTWDAVGGQQTGGGT